MKIRLMTNRGTIIVIKVPQKRKKGLKKQCGSVLCSDDYG